MLSFSLGGSDCEKILLTVHGYERALTGDYHDDNWLTVAVQINAGAFSGKFDAAFLTNDFVSFLAQLRGLYDSLKGEANFSTLEEQLSVRVTGNGHGSIVVEGEAIDQPGIGNKLVFKLAMDQTNLLPALSELDEIVSRFPIRGA
jgi:hypothetical protein